MNNLKFDVKYKPFKKDMKSFVVFYKSYNNTKKLKQLNSRLLSE